MIRRALASLSIAAALTATLAGCDFVGEAILGNDTSYSSTRTWLEDQSIVTAIEEPSEFYDGFARQGELRAELDPSATAAEVEEFAFAAARFLDTQDRAYVQLYAGRDDLDFVVGDEEAVRAALAIWQRLPDLTGVRVALVGGGTVVARGLRADMATMLDSAQSLDAGYEVQGFSDTEALEQVAEIGSYFDSILYGENVVSDHPEEQVRVEADDLVSVLAEADCTPAPGVVVIALEMVADGPHGSLDLCKGWELDYAGRPIGETAIALRARLDAAGIADLPVWLVSRVPEPDAQTRDVRVMPGSADGLGVLRALDAPSALPDKAGYSLGENRDLLLTSFDEPSSRLVALLLASPASAALGTVDVRGEDIAVIGTVDHVQEYQSDAAALNDAAPVFSYLELSADAATLSLRDETTEPAITAAAQALFDNGLWAERRVTVDWSGASFVIDEGDAADLDALAAESDPLMWFHDEWVALR
jgi:hypothetical protein